MVGFLQRQGVSEGGRVPETEDPEGIGAFVPRILAVAKTGRIDLHVDAVIALSA
jgi:hypothetical protein